MLNTLLNKSPICDLFDSRLLLRKGTLLTMIFLFFSCLFTGIFFSFCISSADKEILTAPITELFNNGNAAVLPALFTNILVLAFIFAAGLSLYGFAVSILVLAGKALSIGFCAGLLFYSAGKSSFSILLFSFLPVNILFTFAFIPAAAVSLNYALPAISDMTFREQYRKDYCLYFILFAFIILISSFIEVISYRII